MPNNLITINVVSSDNEIENLRVEWDDLLLRSRFASVFQSWEWISTCRRHFGHGRLLILCVRDRDRLVGLAPLELVSMYGFPLRRLQFIGTGVFDYLDFILDSDSEQNVLGAISGWLGENASTWDLLDLQNISEKSPSRSLVDHFPASDGWNGEMLEGEVCPFLALAGSWEEMQPRFGKKMRFNLGYQERLMRRDFEAVDINTLTDEDLEEGMNAFFRLHTMRWKKRWLPGVLTGERKQGFHRDVASLCLKRGWLHLHGLRIDGRLQAVLYCFAFNGKGYYYLGGFDPELAKYSLGTVLTGFAIRKAIECGCDEFDFLRGNEPYKSRWTKEFRTNSRFILCKSTSRSKASAAICRLEQRVEQKVKHELHKRIGAG